MNLITMQVDLGLEPGVILLDIAFVPGDASHGGHSDRITFVALYSKSLMMWAKMRRVLPL